MILSKCAICGSKKSKFIKKGTGILSNLGIRTPLNKIPLLVCILFLKKIAYKNNVILMFKAWRKCKKHYSTGFKDYKRWNNNISKMHCTQ